MEEEEFRKQKPAFPIPEHADINHLGRNGMTLRDYFAAKAMSAQVANQERLIALHNNSIDEKQTHEWIAETAYELADAMLKERSKS